jgi:hypothetical protein
MTVFSDKFYGILPGEKYKSYGMGLIHKAITINTPHNNTPAADAINEFIPQAGLDINTGLLLTYGNFPNNIIFNFIQPDGSAFKASDAVKNLQVSDLNGGINLATTLVKNHLIAGDVNTYDAQAAETLIELQPYFQLLGKTLKICHRLAPPGLRQVLNGLIKANEIATGLSFIEWYSSQKGFPNFIGDGDFIVPKMSQLALRNPADPTVSVFEGFTSNHVLIKNRNDVGNKVKLLLNSPIAGSDFANDIPAVPGSVNKILNIPDISGRQPEPVVAYDTTSIKIKSPDNLVSLFAERILSIEFNLKDTVGLAYVDIEFQNKIITSLSRDANQMIAVQIDPEFLYDQPIIVKAIYDRDSLPEIHLDTIQVNILTNEPLLGFRVEPYIVELNQNIPFFPEYFSVYSTSIAGVYNNNPDVSINIADPSVVQYDPFTLSFKALSDTGGTYAIISYLGFYDTLYFINVASSPTNTTLNLKLYLEGFYESNGFMRPGLTNQGLGSDFNATDTITVELHDALFPLTITATAKGILKLNGTNTFTFPLQSTPQYIVIKHRNSIETWSSAPVSMSKIVEYNFTTSSTKAFGNNMAQIEPGVWAIYSGDINQDGTVDSNDMAEVDNDASLFAFGYIRTDCTGDGGTDSSDMLILDNNSQLFLFYARPY